MQALDEQVRVASELTSDEELGNVTAQDIMDEYAEKSRLERLEVITRKRKELQDYLAAFVWDETLDDAEEKMRKLGDIGLDVDYPPPTKVNLRLYVRARVCYD